MELLCVFRILYRKSSTARPNSSLMSLATKCKNQMETFTVNETEGRRRTQLVVFFWTPLAQIQGVPRMANFYDSFKPFVCLIFLLPIPKIYLIQARKTARKHIERTVVIDRYRFDDDLFSPVSSHMDFLTRLPFG